MDVGWWFDWRSRDGRNAGRRHRRGRVRRYAPAITGALVSALLVFSASVAVAAAADREPSAIEATATTEVVGPDNPTGGLPDLPVPEPVPEDPYATVPVVEIGSIEIPRIGLQHTMYSGVELTVLDNGPGHWPGTAAPGEWGNTVIAGHRVTNSRPFRDIDQLAPGDEMVVRTETGEHTYVVEGTEIVDPSALRIVDQRPGRRLTLFACHPPGSAAQRIVVHGELVADPAEAAA